ncbi:hypothetical protein [Cryptosporangium phraense]|uniref:Uncharacterized protein n=1 Tax=Cryptosporangium phraense TaxID=2593070 RepID=A0A545ANH4_9ACTN|nr:hypothetical protein [Cryptosporangium phraense]TQS42811.1 hypothetical protein FL583_22410 [Cryptosporangium phraense]
MHRHALHPNLARFTNPGRRLARRLHTRLHDRLPRGDGGYSTETVLVTALLVALAIAVLGIIAAKVLAKANSINLG